jgi:selenocysteine lyase/cysteine desulfurase
MISRPLPVQRELFDIPADVAYLNVASLSPTLRSAVSAGQESLRRRAQPWRIGAADWFSDAERRRELFARLVGATPDGVALVPATSYGFATAAANLDAGPGRRVLVLAEEYPSGIYTWRAFSRRTGAEILTVAREPGQSWTDAVLAACDERVAVVSVPQVHWTDGSLVDLDAVAGRSREVGAALVIDASQSTGAMPLDVAGLAPDFLVTVGYKWLLGPFGLAYLYVAEQYREGRPLEENWIVRYGSERFAALVDYADEYQPGARRYDAGARTAFELTPMAVAALEQLLAWGVEPVAATLHQVTGEVERQARSRGLDVPADRGPHMLGLRLPPGTREPALQALTEAGVHVGPRGHALRVSPHLHTTDEDLQRLFGALDRVL